METQSLSDMQIKQKIHELNMVRKDNCCFDVVIGLVGIVCGIYIFLKVYRAKETRFTCFLVILTLV
jgi:hypothetical protein